jgi:biotin carboxyl carrier protein
MLIALLSFQSMPEATTKKHRMSTKQRLLFFFVAWLIVLMPFLFWWNTWFGRQLSDSKLTEYLQDEQHPRHIQHALVQIGERMAKQDSSVKNVYPELLRLSTHPVEEVRNTDAWVMGQDNNGPGFHEALLKMLNDPSPLVRGNAALSLVRFGDATGKPQILALLQPANVTASQSGKIIDTAAVGTTIRSGGAVAKLQAGDQTIEVRSPITGTLSALDVQSGQSVTAGAEIATLAPEGDQVWEALRALYIIGQPEDLPIIQSYERELPEIPDRVRQQAAETEKAIKSRS